MATVQLGTAIQRGLAASRPASGDATKAGQLYYSTDTKVLEQDDGSSWAVVATNLALGTTGTTAAAGNDSRLSDARTPTTHHTSHNTGGGDAIAPADIGAAAASHTHTASQVTDFAEAVDDRAAALLIEGAGIDLAYNDGAGSLTISADIPALTADASPDGAADYVMTYDASASAHKKVLLDDLPGGGGGGGASDAVDVTYDPTASGLSATDVQAAVDEVAALAGGAIASYGPLYPLYTPVVADFAWVNQGSATAADTDQGILIEKASPTGLWSLLTQALPTAPYAITLMFAIDGEAYGTGGGAVEQAGIGWRDSGSGKLHMVAQRFGEVLELQKWNSPSSFSGTYSATTQKMPTRQVFFARISDDSTDRKVEFSANGVAWALIQSVSRTDWITADEIAIGVNPDATGAHTMLTLLSYDDGSLPRVASL